MQVAILGKVFRPRNENGPKGPSHGTQLHYTLETPAVEEVSLLRVSTNTENIANSSRGNAKGDGTED